MSGRSNRNACMRLSPPRNAVREIGGITWSIVTNLPDVTPADVNMFEGDLQVEHHIGIVVFQW